MKKIVLITVLICSIGLADASYAQEEGKKKAGPPPSLVVVSDVITGAAQPMSEFIGTVYYAQVSEVASEMDGRVEMVTFDEGQSVKSGQKLVVLNTDLIDTAIDGTKAEYERIEVEFDKANKDFNRMEKLYQQKSIAETVYDEHYYSVKMLEKKLVSLKAEMARLDLEKKKKTIFSPFNGIVIDKKAEKGEWVSEGDTIAVVANDREVDVEVSVPENVLGYLEKGRTVRVVVGNREYSGQFIAFIPKGDVATRTFTVKIRMPNSDGLVEGMEARVQLPAGELISGLLVSRDAVVNVMGMDVVFVELDSKAKMIPVSVTGYKDMMVGIQGPGLQPFMKAVIKGNERLRDGQPIRVADAAESGS